MVVEAGSAAGSSVPQDAAHTVIAAQASSQRNQEVLLAEQSTVAAADLGSGISRPTQSEWAVVEDPSPAANT